MDSIQEGRDENSLSGISFPSLNYIYSQEEEEDEGGMLATADHTDSSSSSSGGEDKERMDAVKRNLFGDNDNINGNINCNDYGDDYDDDGYPTDEHTIHSFTQPREKEIKRLSILQLARNRLSKKKSNVDKPPPPAVLDTMDRPSLEGDTSFLANADIANVSDTPPDDSTFLGNADVGDVSTVEGNAQYHMQYNNFNNFNDGRSISDDSYYDIHASTLSRASASTKASTIGDQILKESAMAARMTSNNDKIAPLPPDDNQSASTYSYRRAYVDNLTLGSNFTSTCSALTDDYCFDARRTGMSEAIKGTKEEIVQEEDLPYTGDDIVKRSYSGPVDADTGAMLVQPSDNISHEESLARPPPLPYQPNQFGNNNLMAYDNPEHLTRIVSFGEGEGYVDEEAARKYAVPDGGNSSGCCSWLTSSSRTVKLVVLCSLLLMMISIASVALAMWWPVDEKVMQQAQSSAKSSGVQTETEDEPTRSDGSVIDMTTNEVGEESLMPTRTPTLFPSRTYPPTSVASSLFVVGTTATTSSCTVGAECFNEGSQCTDGTTESCCGETYVSFICDCARNAGDGNLVYQQCYFTDACFAKTCEENTSSDDQTASPTLPPSRFPSRRTTLVPSGSSESSIFTTSSSAITDVPTNQPSLPPTTRPTVQPSPKPTLEPTRQPSKRPSSSPSSNPSVKPTNEPTPRPSRQPSNQPTPQPSKQPSSQPTHKPSMQPTSQFPTSQPTPIPTKFPISTNIPTTSEPVPTPALSQTVTLQCSEDTYVNAMLPNANFDTYRNFRVDGSPQLWSFISFDTQSIIENAVEIQKRQGQTMDEKNNEPRNMQAIQVSEAKLRLYTLDEGGGALIYALPHTKKSLSGLTWNTMYYYIDRTDEFRVSSSDWFYAYRWYEIDVTDSFRDLGSNIVSTFLLKSYSKNGVQFASRERDSGEYSPELVMTFTTYSNSADSPPTPWPTTYFPTAPPTPAPSQHPSKKPSYRPTQYPTKRPSTSPTPIPSQAPHKPNRYPTASPPPTYALTDTLIIEKKSIEVVPSGCNANSDINFAVKEVSSTHQSTHNMHILFPIQDASIRGSSFSDKNFGSSEALKIDSSGKALIEFDLSLLATSSIMSAVLRIFVASVSDPRTITLDSMIETVGWHENEVTWNKLGAPPLLRQGPSISLTQSDEGKWIDVDVSGLIVDTAPSNKFVLVLNDTMSIGEAGKSVFASRETCWSPKLVVITEDV